MTYWCFICRLQWETLGFECYYWENSDLTWW